MIEINILVEEPLSCAVAGHAQGPPLAGHGHEGEISNAMQGVVRQFARSHSVWEAAVDVVAELDALMSLAAVADVGSVHGPMCRPKLVEGHGSQQVAFA